MWLVTEIIKLWLSLAVGRLTLDTTWWHYNCTKKSKQNITSSLQYKIMEYNVAQKQSEKIIDGM